jgi:hypothetical protein
MKLRALMELRGEGTDFELWGPISPIPKAHAPSLKNPKHVPVDTAQQGWGKNDPVALKKRAREDMAVILRRVARQPGKPTPAETAGFPLFPNIHQSQ